MLLFVTINQVYRTRSEYAHISNSVGNVQYKQQKLKRAHFAGQCSLCLSSGEDVRIHSSAVRRQLGHHIL